MSVLPRARTAVFRPVPTFLLPFSANSSSSSSSSSSNGLRQHPVYPQHQQRQHHQHKNLTRPPIPNPTPFVPDVPTFLTLIGRKLSQHASKISSWTHLFSLTGSQLRELGVEPPRSRRYLLRWCQRFRNGQYGLGGELTHVEDGVAHLRVVEVPSAMPRPATISRAANTRKIVVNVDSRGTVLAGPRDALVPVAKMKIAPNSQIQAPHVLLEKETGVGKLVVKEGLWEDRRGIKVDGGERRKAEVRAKRRVEERRKAAR